MSEVLAPRYRVVACTVVTPPGEHAFADVTLEFTDGDRVRQQVGLAQAQQLIEAAGEA